MRSHLTDASLQHNYSNISPVSGGQHGPASVVSSNMSAVSGGQRSEVTGQYPPPVPSTQPPVTQPPGARTPPSERQRRRERSAAEEMKRSRLAEVSDLTRLQGPLTEDAVVKTLQARFYNQQYQVQTFHLLSKC